MSAILPLATLRLLSGFNLGLVLFTATGLATLAWWLYRREVQHLGLGLNQWLLPTLRALAIFLIVMTLAEPAWESRHRQGQPGHIHFLLDGSASMSITADELKAPDQSGVIETIKQTDSRFQRASQRLIGESPGLLQQLAEQFEISVWRADSSGNLLLWDSNLNTFAAENPSEQPQPSAKWIPESWSRQTSLGQSLTQVKEALSFRDQAGDPGQQGKQIVVLLSDGHSNSGSSPQLAAEELAKMGVQLTTVGYGPEQSPYDLALQSFTVPERLYKTDRLAGRFILSDMLEPNAPFEAQVLLDDVVVWRQSYSANRDLQREIKFDFPIAETFQRAEDALPAGVRYNSIPLKLTARLVASGSGTAAVNGRLGEQNLDNNQQQAYVSVGASKAKILLIDGRSRWETRYLKNLFSRDPAWQLTTVIAGEPTAQDQMPKTRDQWLGYHLVVLGDAPAELWNTDSLSGLSDLVLRGGGLIMIDGSRNHLRESGYAAIQPLFPVDFARELPDESNRERSQWRSQLTATGGQLDALSLVSPAATATSGNSSSNMQFWQQLPALEYVHPSLPAMGAEVLVEAEQGGDRRPLLATRRFGSGRVMYMASDESWRWRFKIADQVHQRLWNQLARWLMRKPLSIETEFLSLDSGSASYKERQPIELRANLRQPDGTPAEGRQVVAVLWKDQQIIARAKLPAESANPGSYASAVQGLPVGDYEVSIEADGFTQEVLTARTRFAVIESDPSQEMLSTTCNVELLQQLSQTTGGSYLHESQIGQLPELLRPLSGGRIVHSTQLLWQSYFWFVLALALLALEWILRKRSSLV